MSEVEILVVEDDQLTRETIRDLLCFEGYQVVTASGGNAALQALTHARPDLILVDYAMPGMNGAEFVHAYRRLGGPQAPIVLLSALAEARHHAATIQVADYLEKPFAIDALLGVINRCLRFSVVQSISEGKRAPTIRGSARVTSSTPRAHKHPEEFRDA